MAAGYETTSFVGVVRAAGVAQHTTIEWLRTRTTPAMSRASHVVGSDHRPTLRGLVAYKNATSDD